MLTSLVDHDGAVNPGARERIVMCVYNVAKETVVSSYQSTIGTVQISNGSNPLSIVNPPLFVDIHLMFMANFSEGKYPDGLAALSRLIGYFQQTPCFTPENAPALEAGIDKLTIEMESLGPVDVNYVMGMLGTRYLPSAFYKLRMIPFVSPAMRARSYAIGGMGLAGTGSTP